MHQVERMKIVSCGDADKNRNVKKRKNLNKEKKKKIYCSTF